MNVPYLSYVIWLPIVIAIVVLLAGNKRPYLVKPLAIIGALSGFVVSLPLYFLFDLSSADMQFVEQAEWIPLIGARYALGVDGIAMPLVLLNSFITCLIVIAAWHNITRQPAYYYAAFLLMSGILNGIFSATDGLLFYVFFEASLIPLYLIIGIWGGENRVYAAFKFFLYTLFGSVLLLVALFYLAYRSDQTFAIANWHNLALSLTEQKWLFWAFLAAFAVKVPMWPVHTWLPDAHVEAPTGGSVVLAAIALKLGAYGFIRFSLPIVPDASQYFATLVIVLSLVAVVYIGLVALVQKDMKKLIAYSSIAHMGFVTLGFFLFNTLGVEGALVQMISHGFVSGALFLCIGVLYDRVHSRQISDYGGVAQVMPIFAAFFVLFAMGNAGLPGTSGFVGELMVILAAAQVHFMLAALAATTLILGAAYTLWMVKRVLFGALNTTTVAMLKDLNSNERIVLSVLAACVLFFGIYPLPLTEIMHASVDALLEHVVRGKL